MDRFTLSASAWCSWQMLPGYVGDRMIPYCSPIYIRSATPLKTGNGLLRVSFFNALYAEGGQDFELGLKVLKRASNYLLADLPYDPERSALVGHIEFPWLEKFCPELMRMRSPSSHTSVSQCLDEIFGI